MMSLIPCHHFSAQDVLSVSDEPLVVCGAGTNLFVATAGCSIGHYLVTKNASEQCEFVGSFPSVALVHQMAYSEKGEWTVMNYPLFPALCNMYNIFLCNICSSVPCFLWLMHRCMEIELSSTRNTVETAFMVLTAYADITLCNAWNEVLSDRDINFPEYFSGVENMNFQELDWLWYATLIGTRWENL